jgi:hypothetical protein
MGGGMVTIVDDEIQGRELDRDVAVGVSKASCYGRGG